jgi:hypothetical protein
MTIQPPPFPTSPAVGARYKNWVWNGTSWVCSPGPSVNIQVFNANGSYFPSPGMTFAIVETVGGGGAGGGVNATAATFGLSGGGGGAGGYSRRAVSAGLVAGGVAITVGGGGPPGSGANGAAGAATTFGALCIANGGQGGGGNSNPGPGGNSGAGGSMVGAVGDLVSAGNAGGAGTSATFTTGEGQITPGGEGAGGPWGGSSLVALGVAGSSPGLPGNGPGAGGSGGVVNDTIAEITGGSGANGVCVVTEYVFSPVSTGDCGGGGMARVGFDGWDGQ